MPLLTTVIDDKSPLIQYDSTWIPGSSNGDLFAAEYYLGTFQVCTVSGGRATFNFNGTAVWVYGAHRNNHGNFTVTVDNYVSPLINGYTTDIVGQFQVLLFNTSSPLPQGTHQLTFTNQGGPINFTDVDIDMIVFQSEVGNAGDQLVGEVVPDTDPRFQYQGSAWSTNPGSSGINFNLFNNGTGHITQAPGATVTFKFEGTRFVICGEAVTIFGTSGPYNGEYSVQLDGGQSLPYNATGVSPINYGIVIYHADNLGPGSHQLVLTNLAGSTSQALTIDYAQLWTTTSATSTSNNISAGVIAGLVVEGVVAILAAAAAVFFYWRWKVQRPNLDTHWPPFDQPSVVMSSTYAPTQHLVASAVTSSVDRPTAPSDLSQRTDIAATSNASGSGNTHIDAFLLPSTGHEDAGRRPGGIDLKNTRRRDQTVRDAGARPLSSSTSEPPPPDYHQVVERRDS